MITSLLITSLLQYILLVGGRIVYARDKMLIFFMTILIYDGDIAIYINIFHLI